MRLRIPDYYKEFKCSADRCADSCCIGWELDIDPGTYDYYMQVPGPFGDRLRAMMEDARPDRPDGDEDTGGDERSERASFRLSVNGRCPFLAENGLCDIITELGPEALSIVCTEYPRWTTEFGDTVEKSLTVSCEEAAKLVFFRENPAEYVFEDTSAEAPGADTSCEEMSCSETGGAGSEAENEFEEETGLTAEETAMAEIVFLAREKAFKIIKDRTVPLGSRIAAYLSLAAGIRDVLNRTEEINEETVREAERVLPDPHMLRKEEEDPYEMFLLRLDLLGGMEIINDRWEETESALRAAFTEENYASSIGAYLAADPDAEKDEEQYLSYLTFRYFPRAAWDFDLLGKAKFAVCMLLLLRDLDAYTYAEKGTFTKEDRIRTAGLIARQIEHSDYNVYVFMEELTFAAELTPEALSGLFS